MSVVTDQSPFRVLDGELLDATCPSCGRAPDADALREPQRLPIDAISSTPLRTALASAGADALKTRGATCRDAHRRLTLLHAVEDAFAEGWDQHLGVPVDCGPQGQQLVPVAVGSLPARVAAAALRGLQQRGDGDGE